MPRNKTFRKEGGTKNKKKKRNIKKTRKKYKMKGGRIKYTYNKNIARDTNDENILYVKQDYLPELEKQNPFIYKNLQEIGTIQFNGVTYIKLESTIRFYNVKDDEGNGDSPKKINELKKNGAIENDCIGFAEKCIVKDLYKETEGKDFTKISTNDIFGISDEENIRIANKIKKKSKHKSHKVNPKIGEGYIIMPTKEKLEECPYHGACVAFKDGDSNITLEANAGDKLSRKPIFDFYSSGKVERNTFHHRHKDDYTVDSQDPVTDTLRPINELEPMEYERPRKRYKMKGGAGTKRKKSASTNTYKKTKYKEETEEKMEINFRNLINFISSDGILKKFYNFLKNNINCKCNIFTEKSRGFRPSEHTPCLVFDGAHWKGYDNESSKLVEYDSYRYKVQLGQTNNFCQSFACYLLANKGIHELKPGVYYENIQCLSKKWLEYLDHETNREFLQDEVNGANSFNKKNHSNYVDFTLNDIKITLNKLVNDDNYARILSQSRESI